MKFKTLYFTSWISLASDGTGDEKCRAEFHCSSWRKSLFFKLFDLLQKWGFGGGGRVITIWWIILYQRGEVVLHNPNKSSSGGGGAILSCQFLVFILDIYYSIQQRVLEEMLPTEQSNFTVNLCVSRITLSTNVYGWLNTLIWALFHF